MGTAWKVAVAVILCSFHVHSFSDREHHLIRSLHTFFSTRLCVVLGDRHKMVKFLSSENILSISISIPQFKDVLESGLARKKYRNKTMVIARYGPDLLELFQLHDSSVFVWIVFKNADDDVRITRIPIKGEVLMIRSNSSSTILLQLHLAKVGQDVVSEDFGNMTSDGVINFPDHQTYSRGRGNLRQAVLDFAVVQKKPCIHMEKLNVFPKSECLHHDIFTLMATRMNFTKNPIEVEDKAYLYVFPNGTHSGLFKMVLDGDVDGASGGFVVSNNRMETYDFVWPTFVLKTVMYIESGKMEDTWLVFLKPFDRLVWMAVLSSIVLFSVTSWAFAQFICEKKSFLNVLNILFIAFLDVSQVFCYQGAKDIPTASSMKILYATMLFAVVVLLPAYSGSIVSSLTTHKPTLPFSDIEGLFSDGRYRVTAVRTSFVPIFFQSSYQSKRNLNWKKSVVDSVIMPESDEEALADVCKEPMAFVGFELSQRVLENSPCRVIALPTPVFFQFLGIGLQKNSPYTEYLMRELTYFQSSGIMYRMESHFKQRRKKGESTKISSVAFGEIISGLIVLALGFFIAVFILLLEILCWSSEKPDQGRWHAENLFVERCVGKNRKRRFFELHGV